MFQERVAVFNSNMSLCPLRKDSRKSGAHGGIKLVYGVELNSKISQI